MPVEGLLVTLFQKVLKGKYMFDKYFQKFKTIVTAAMNYSTEGG